MQKGCCLVVAGAVALTAMEDSASWTIAPPITPAVKQSESLEETWSPGPKLLRWIPEKAPTPTFFRAGELSFFLGARLLEDDIYQQLEAATQAGVAIALGPRRWWLRPYVGVQYAQASGAYRRPPEGDWLLTGFVDEPRDRGKMTVRLLEGDVGTKCAWSVGPFQHHIGVGLCVVKASIQETQQETLYLSAVRRDVTSRQDHDTNVGWWLSTSLTTTLAGVVVGVEGRLTDAQVTLFNQPVQAGGLQIGATAAWAW